ncbi:MAG: APC family permease [Deltaproteobacteria bacterium]|nr:APC family permease [Deltaproteobacteria bacterium]MBW1873785.1 APC family permease [Deltaproteobacteria bacterium]MBW2209417.1 APC family permease [Deltaproteobacteria bacterium]MBW2213631.1 APC family permease [Deltaproteobacteria bacterium]MBW2379703.1 APC family permease [Deltaproteobacteria bacterium]
MGFLDLGSGVGLVVANMIGAGVFLSAGFMAQELSAGWILLAWVVGALLAMAGARTYAEAAVLIPRSGGEYRYLSELLHPAVGYLAGWASLLVGFSAPTAISAFGAAAFIFAVFGAGDARLGATALIVTLTAFHAVGLRLSKWTQNGLVIIKGLLVLAFIALGLSMGDNQWPTWVPVNESTGTALPFATSLFFVAYAFSGWNAAAYAAEEFRAPRRDVPRAMLIGCALVGTAYLLVNWVLLSNLTPERAGIVLQYEEGKVTLGHLVARDFLGDAGANAMSIGIAAIMVSSASAMLLVGPRVYAEMARDGFLPSFLRAKPGSPPRASVVLQGALAILLLYVHTIGELLSNVAGILVFFSALVAIGLFRVRRHKPNLRAPRPQALIAAAIYAGSSIWMLYNAFKTETGLIPWIAVAVAAGLVGYSLAPKQTS